MISPTRLAGLSASMAARPWVRGWEGWRAIGRGTSLAREQRAAELSGGDGERGRPAAGAAEAIRRGHGDLDVATGGRHVAEQDQPAAGDLVSCREAAAVVAGEGAGAGRLVDRDGGAGQR